MEPTGAAWKAARDWRRRRVAGRSSGGGRLAAVRRPLRPREGGGGGSRPVPSASPQRGRHERRGSLCRHLAALRKVEGPLPWALPPAFPLRVPYRALPQARRCCARSRATLLSYSRACLLLLSFAPVIKYSPVFPCCCYFSSVSVVQLFFHTAFLGKFVQKIIRMLLIIPSLQ